MNEYKNLENDVDYGVEQLLDLFGPSKLSDRIKAGDFFKVNEQVPAYRKLL